MSQVETPVLPSPRGAEAAKNPKTRLTAGGREERGQAFRSLLQTLDKGAGKAVAEKPTEPGRAETGDKAEAFPAERLADADWTPGKLEAAMAPYFAEHGAARVDPEARSPKHLDLAKNEFTWDLRQTVLDADGETPFHLAGYVDLEASRVEGRAVLKIKHVGA